MSYDDPRWEWVAVMTVVCAVLVIVLGSSLPLAVSLRVFLDVAAVAMTVLALRRAVVARRQR